MDAKRAEKSAAKNVGCFVMELEVFMALYPKNIKSLDDAREYREAGQEGDVWKSITKHPTFKAAMDAKRAEKSATKADTASALPTL